MIELQVLEGLATWYSLHLEDAETNPQLASLFREADRKRDEGDTLVSTSTTCTHIDIHMLTVVLTASLG